MGLLLFRCQDYLGKSTVKTLKIKTKNKSYKKLLFFLISETESVNKTNCVTACGLGSFQSFPFWLVISFLKSQYAPR